MLDDPIGLGQSFSAEEEKKAEPEEQDLLNESAVQALKAEIQVIKSEGSDFVDIENFIKVTVLNTFATSAQLGATEQVKLINAITGKIKKQISIQVKQVAQDCISGGIPCSSILVLHFRELQICFKAYDNA